MLERGKFDIHNAQIQTKDVKCVLGVQST